MLYYSKKEELTPIYDSRKSFYKKAYTETIGEDIKPHAEISKIKLYSYNTLVCSIEYLWDSNRIYHLHVGKVLLTQTTLRHIKEFLQQLFYCNRKKITKKDLMINSDKIYDLKKDLEERCRKCDSNWLRIMQ